MKSLLFKSNQDIKSLNNINQLSIDIIENRAKAIQDNTLDKESWRYRSFDGFIGENESFKSRLETDWSLLENYNKENNCSITHITLSSILKEIINQCEQTRKQLGFGPMAPIKLILDLNNFKNDIQFSFLFNNNSSNNNTIELYISKNIFNGFQYSLFWNENSKEKEKLIWNTKWNVEYNILNVKNQKQFIVSGDSQSGIIQYIEYLGFYEGDENNQYRINPIHLISLLLNK